MSENGEYLVKLLNIEPDRLTREDRAYYDRQRLGRRIDDGFTRDECRWIDETIIRYGFSDYEESD